MATSKIFIASSGRTLVLARQLRDQLDKKYCDAELWKDVGERKVGKSILGMLKEATLDYDFAVIILAKDDVMITEAKKAKATDDDSSGKAKARDNCVFEAGLFMGVIGEERCFLLSSVDEGNLPTDLGGIIYIRFAEPKNLKDEKECREKIRAASNRISTLVSTARPRIGGRISRQRLLERERRYAEGGDLFGDHVVVASMQPLEVDVDAAKQVRKNIDLGNIRYVYFFQGNKEGAEKTCELLQKVVLGNILESQADADNWPLLMEKVKNNQDKILDDLKQIASQERIKIHFLRGSPEFEYCIHNAQSLGAAKMYLKRGEEFIEWIAGKDAYQFWDRVRNAQGALYPVPRKAVIHGVPGFNVNEGTFLTDLGSAMDTYFPGIGEKVMRLCLEGPEGKAQQGQPVAATARVDGPAGG
jgi:predicted nucleotide-binding protein